ncbi:MAG TPA: cation:proton antiporter [Nitrososphaeraceae archaeon]|jgi:CPA2 family monovalent cation:H+ antiporter-2|nr:cation:proton antiporter [Nitrososphaeraceae archaeon]
MNHSSTSTLPQILSPNGSSAIISDTIVQDFAVIMIVAAIMVLLTYKLKQPMVLGYIIAGMVIGPYTPPFQLLQDIDTINIFAELGIIMLLFVIGTDFPLQKLRSVGRISIVVASAETIGTLLLTLMVGQYLGFTFFDSIFIALAMSITSTVVTVKILEELGMLQDTSSTLLLGISIVEDIIAISALGVLQSVAADPVSTSNGMTNLASILQVLVSIGVVTAFVGGIIILGSRYLPNLVDKIGKTNDYALLLLVILGLAVGLSFGASLLGLSVATGAFLAGVLVAESKSANVARVITTPIRDLFAALFFISIGALMDISLIPTFIIPAMILILASFASKFVIIATLLNRAKYDNATSLRSALGMASAKGELSLVVAKGGQDVGATTSAVLPILGVVTIVTTFMTPYILRFGSKLTNSSKS